MSRTTTTLRRCITTLSTLDPSNMREVWEDIDFIISQLKRLHEQSQAVDMTMRGTADPPSVPEETSEDAADSIKPRAGSMRQAVLEFIIRNGGATDEQIQIALDMSNNSERPRRRELVQQGLVVDSGKRRLNRSGCKAIVWTLKGSEW